MEKNQIYLEDNLETLSKMSDDYYDMVITSPPYDDIRKYNGFLFDIDMLAPELYRTTKKGGIVVWVVNDQVVKGSESGTGLMLPTSTNCSFSPIRFVFLPQFV